MAMNQTAQDLLNQYLGYLNPSTDVFSQDVMSPNDFSKPFDAWANNAIDQYLRPEFLRYQYNPYVKQGADAMANMNQSIGLSGGWRTAQSGRDLNDAAYNQMLGVENLNRQYNDQAMQVRDAFKQGWSDPLYKSRMENYYNAPWRNMDTGGNAPQYSSTIPGLNGWTPNQTQPGGIAPQPGISFPLPGGQQVGGALPNMLNKYGDSVRRGPMMDTDMGMNRSQPQGQQMANAGLISQYLTKPMNFQNPYNILQQQ